MNFKFLLVLLISYQIGQAQELQQSFIEVVGYAETEIVPDEIYYLIELKEFTENKSKVTLDTLEARLYDILSNHQIPIENIEISDVYSRKYYIRRKDQEVLRTKSFTIKFNNIQQLDEFGQSIEGVPVEKASITKLNYTQILILEEKLKIQALENAKAKATKLLKAVGETLGEVISISEFYENDIRSYLENYMSFVNYNQVLHYGSIGNENKDIQFKKSKLGVTIKAKFNIKR